MLECKISIETQPDSKQVDFLEKRLHEFNVDKIGEYQYTPLFLFVRDSEQKVVGGLDGFMGLGWLHISTLWVAEELRGCGYGRTLVETAEQEAFRHGCFTIMNSKTAELTASITPQRVQSFHGLDSREIMNLLLSKGYYDTTLKGAFIEEFTRGIFLFVDEDAQLLMDEYFYLEKLLAIDEPYQHGSCLNSGLVTFTATSNRTMVRIEFRYCPQLNVANLVTNNLTVTEDEYVWWWRSIAQEILNIISLK